MRETGRGRLRKPSVYENHPRQFAVAARSSLILLLALPFLGPSLCLPCVFENALTPFVADPVRRGTPFVALGTMEVYPMESVQMIKIVAKDELLRELENTDEVIEFVDANGKRLGTLVRPPSDEDVRIAKERLAGDAKRYTTEQVVDHLRSLEES